VEPYVAHRLSRAGWNGRPDITGDAFTALYAETGGVPRKLNTLMNRLMLMGAVEQLDVLDGRLVGAVIVDMAGTPFDYSAPMSSQAPDVARAPQTIAHANEPAFHIPTNGAEVDALISSITTLEARVSEQDVALRRVLAMMIDYMARESDVEARLLGSGRAA
ncbi:MAG: hypothetical protein ACRETL_06610, partial [Gammaproteobacteria bacterium]